MTKKLGSGTYAQVFEGTYLGTNVAVKCFTKEDPKCLKAYNIEMEVLSWMRLNGTHPNLIHMFGGFQDQKSCYMVLE